MPELFRIAAPQMAPYITILVILLVLLALALLFLTLLFSIKNIRYLVTEEGLWIRSLFYGRSFSWEEIQRGSVRIVDLETEKEWQPALRTNGVGLPGFWSGWFKLNNGEKALLFVTQRSQVVCFSTPEFFVMLSAAMPQKLLNALRG